MERAKEMMDVSFGLFESPKCISQGGTLLGAFVTAVASLWGAL